MATRFVFTAQSAEFPASSFAGFGVVNGRPVVAFDTATAETAYWTFAAPQGLATPLTAVITYFMQSATTGGVAFDVALEAVTSGDALALQSTTSFDAANTVTDSAVPGTLGYMKQISVTLSNNDTIAAADYVRLSVTRAVANATDTAAGDCYVLAVELRDAA